MRDYNVILCGNDSVVQWESELLFERNAAHFKGTTVYFTEFLVPSVGLQNILEDMLCHFYSFFLWENMVHFVWTLLHMFYRELQCFRFQKMVFFRRHCTIIPYKKIVSFHWKQSCILWKTITDVIKRFFCGGDIWQFSWGLVHLMESVLYFVEWRVAGWVIVKEGAFHGEKKEEIWILCSAPVVFKTGAPSLNHAHSFVFVIPLRFIMAHSVFSISGSSHAYHPCLRNAWALSLMRHKTFVHNWKQLPKKPAYWNKPSSPDRCLASWGQARTGWAGVRIPCLVEVTRLICSMDNSVAAYMISKADWSLIFMLLGWLSPKEHTTVQSLNPLSYPGLCTKMGYLCASWQ